MYHTGKLFKQSENSKKYFKSLSHLKQISKKNFYYLEVTVQLV